MLREGNRKGGQENKYPNKALQKKSESGVLTERVVQNSRKILFEGEKGRAAPQAHNLPTFVKF